MTAVTIYSDFGAWENKVCHYFHCFPIYFPRSDGTRCHGLHFLNVELVFPSICHEVIGPDVMIFVFWMLSFKPTFSLYSFTYIKRLFSSCSLSAIREVLSACLRLLIFLPEILIPACASSSLAFHMMYSVYKLNMQGNNIQPWHIPFPIWNQSVVPCPVLTTASWSAFRFLRRQIRWSGIPISKNFPQFVFILISYSQRL